MRDLKDYKDIVYKIIGAAMTVHRELSWGLMEGVYQEALHLELLDRGVENEMEKQINCYYKNRLMDKQYRMDIVVGDIVVELKSVKELLSVHRAQLFNYLRLTKKPLGILINFGSSSLEGERYAFIESENECVMLDKNMNMLVQEDDTCNDSDEW
ncbi:MAG: GxxExxY protein [Bacteroidales bacterium]|nr:GxxExxY protein [Bacteroidales bacterium]